MVSVSMVDVQMNSDRYIARWVFTNKQMDQRILNKEILKFWPQSTGHMRYTAEYLID